MCYNIVTEFKCANKHKQAGENRLRFKHIAKCTTAVQSPISISCPPVLRDCKHVLQKDDSKDNCFKCKGEMSLKTP